ncbi:unnamed protein product [Dovyalis caffra]|uniref:3'-5' exonuclease domain-containing protein n=1 Tax=Dovyalis caffra TaxID=77055 RepID=A0AAV1SW95_9ROSI|nr:unnamed protein product [Dovyalis caffra]
MDRPEDISSTLQVPTSKIPNLKQKFSFHVDVGRTGQRRGPRPRETHLKKKAVDKYPADSFQVNVGRTGRRHGPRPRETRLKKKRYDTVTLKKNKELRNREEQGEKQRKEMDEKNRQGVWRAVEMELATPYQTYISLPVDSGRQSQGYEALLSLVPFHIVTHASQLPKEFLFPSSERQLVVGFDCEGVDLCRYGKLRIIQLAFPDAIYLVDAIEGGEKLIKACKPALESSFVAKVIHDCKRDRDNLSAEGNTPEEEILSVVNVPSGVHHRTVEAGEKGRSNVEG